MAIKAALPCAATFAAALMYPFAAAAQSSAAPQPTQPESSAAAAASPAPSQGEAKPSAAADAVAKPKERPASKPEGKRAERQEGGATMAPPPADEASAQAQCAWVGKRVVSLLVRDDVDTASDFTRFYAMFNCPDAHIGATLACVVSDPGAAREGAALTEHVDLCWANPSTRLLPQKPPNPDKPAPTAAK